VVADTGLLRTPLYEAHLRAGARMVDFAGWSMPLLYASILQEHQVTRTAATVFDVSHMGRLHIRGDSAFKLLDRACTADVVHQEDNTALYSLLCNDSGGIIDDIFVYRLAEAWMVVCNASNREKVLSHLERLNRGGFGAVIEDQTLQTAMLAVQGPEALAILQSVLPMDLAAMHRRQVVQDKLMVFNFIASRTGYTGEAGLEVILPKAAALPAWEFLTSPRGGVKPAGLGSRDVLRLEAGLPLYGHELNEQTSPISAGLGFAVREEGDYVGAPVIADIRRRKPARRLVGLRLEGPRIARQGMAVHMRGREVGVITSGTFGPSCQASIAMAYIDYARARPGRSVTVRLREDQDLTGQIVRLPFYRGSAKQ
jgi:aminomethyltransferase